MIRLLLGTAATCTIVSTIVIIIESRYLPPSLSPSPSPPLSLCERAFIPPYVLGFRVFQIEVHSVRRHIERLTHGLREDLADLLVLLNSACVRVIAYTCIYACYSVYMYI